MIHGQVQHEKMMDIEKKFAPQVWNIIPSLNVIQKEKACILERDICYLAKYFNVPEMQLYELITFFPSLTLQKKGKHVIQVSRCLSIQPDKRNELADYLVTELGIGFGETTDDGLFSLEWVDCLGCCDQGNVVKIDDRIYPIGNTEKLGKIVKGFRLGKLSDEWSEYLPDSIKDVSSFYHLKSGTALEKYFSMTTDEKEQNHFFNSIFGSKELVCPIQTVICNADEEDMGSFRDRALLQEYIHEAIAGMTMAGLELQAKQGFLLLPDQYSYLQPLISNAIQKRQDENLLGESIQGHKDKNFNIRIFPACGYHIARETDFMSNFLQGKRLYPGSIYNKEGTYFSNVMEYAQLAMSIGAGKGKIPFSDSLCISVAGDCARPGVYEFPKITTIAQVLRELGVEDTQGVLLDGVRGCYIPALELDIPLDQYNGINSVIILNNDRDLMDVVIHILEYFRHISCGICTPCREGIPVLIDSLHKAKGTKHTPYPMNELCSLAQSIKLASRCGHGQSAANIFLSVFNNPNNSIPTLQN